MSEGRVARPIFGKRGNPGHSFRPELNFGGVRTRVGTKVTEGEKNGHEDRGVNRERWQMPSTIKVGGEGPVPAKGRACRVGAQAPGGTRELWGFGSPSARGPLLGTGGSSSCRGRGVQDILIAMIDGLTGFPEAIHAVFPQTVIHQ